MKFDESVSPYLSGQKFSNGLKILISERKSKLDDRINYIKNITKDKKIVHLGFCDHVPLIEKKIENGHWLHQILIDNCNMCVGIDIDDKSVKLIKETIGTQNIYTHDITSSELLPVVSNNKYDYLIVGEVLEHIANPVEFLTKIRNNYKENFDRIIISVPNAFNYTNFRLLFKHEEFINTDHKYWFTPYTLTKVITLSGFNVSGYDFVESYKRKRYRIKSFLKRRYPALCSTIVMTASF